MVISVVIAVPIAISITVPIAISVPIPVIPIMVSVPIPVGGLPTPGSVAGRGDVSVWRTCRNAVVPVNILHALFMLTTSLLIVVGGYSFQGVLLVSKRLRSLQDKPIPLSTS